MLKPFTAKCDIKVKTSAPKEFEEMSIVESAIPAFIVPTPKQPFIKMAYYSRCLHNH